MTKLRNFFLLALIALVSACDKSEDPVAGPPCLITTHVLGSTSYTFTYDGQVMTSMTQTVGTSSLVSTFEYDGGRLTKLVQPGDVSIAFTYTGDNITLLETFSGSRLTDKTEYEYSGNNLVKIQEYANIGVGLQKHDYRTFDYASNSDNIIQERRYSGTSTSPNSVANFVTYGVNHAALSAAPPAVVKFFKLNGQPIGLNIVKIALTTGEEINYTYEFNEKGFPTKTTATNSSGTPTVATYTYNCN